MSELFILCFGFSLGYLLKRGESYWELNKAYKKGQKMGLEIGLNQGKDASQKLKVYGENEKQQVIWGLMDLQSWDKE